MIHLEWIAVCDKCSHVGVMCGRSQEDALVKSMKDGWQFNPMEKKLYCHRCSEQQLIEDWQPPPNFQGD